MRITAARRTETENRIRAAMDRLLRGEIPPDGNCDIKTLAREADVDRTAFYGKRPYAHLRDKFERRLERLRRAGQSPDPHQEQIARLKNEISSLHSRLSGAQHTIEELADFRRQVLARLAAKHEEIIRLRAVADGTGRVIRLPTSRDESAISRPRTEPSTTRQAGAHEIPDRTRVNTCRTRRSHTPRRSSALAT